MLWAANKLSARQGTSNRRATLRDEWQQDGFDVSGFQDLFSHEAQHVLGVFDAMLPDHVGQAEECMRLHELLGLTASWWREDLSFLPRSLSER